MNEKRRKARNLGEKKAEIKIKSEKVRATN